MSCTKLRRQVDLLINNAGYHPGARKLDQLDHSNWQAVFYINVIAPLSSQCCIQVK